MFVTSAVKIFVFKTGDVTIIVIIIIIIIIIIIMDYKQKSCRYY
jgi:hypothetical protein